MKEEESYVYFFLFSYFTSHQPLSWVIIDSVHRNDIHNSWRRLVILRNLSSCFIFLLSVRFFRIQVSISQFFLSVDNLLQERIRWSMVNLVLHVSQMFTFYHDNTVTHSFVHINYLQRLTNRESHQLAFACCRLHVYDLTPNFNTINKITGTTSSNERGSLSWPSS